MALTRSFLALLVVAALGAPFVLVARAGSALVAPLAEASVGVLLRISEPLATPRVEPEPTAGAVSQASELDGVARASQLELAKTSSSKSGPHSRRAVAKAAPPALFVGRATVLRLSQSNARPHGSFVSRTAEHPAGLQLSGVSALGIGVQDGDVLIEALGIAPRSAGQVVGAILEARARRVTALGGTVWRQGQTFPITVEQPY